MKITVLRNNVIDSKSITDGLTMAQNLLADIGLKLELTYKDIDLPLKAFPMSSDVVQNGYMVGIEPILNAIDGTEDIGLLIFNWHKLAPFDWGPSKPINPVTSGYRKGKAIPMQIPEQWYGEPPHPEVLTQFFLHELCHALYMLTGQSTIDKTHFQATSAYNNKSATSYYLFLLAPLIITWNKLNPPMLQELPPTYKYFNPKSDPLMVGVSPILMRALDKIRELSGVPIQITSGLRTVAQNTAAGGKPNSAHLKGLAVDIACDDNAKRTKYVRAILNCGIPVFLEVATKHLHIDIDLSIHAMDTMIVSNDD